MAGEGVGLCLQLSFVLRVPVCSIVAICHLAVSFIAHTLALFDQTSQVNPAQVISKYKHFCCPCQNGQILFIRLYWTN